MSAEALPLEKQEGTLRLRRDAHGGSPSRPGSGSRAACPSYFSSGLQVPDKTRTLTLGAEPWPGKIRPRATERDTGVASWELRAGVFYGLQSLKSLLPVAAPGRTSVDLPAVRVVDTPRFGYPRPAPGRGAFPAQGHVVLDLMARYKLNALHFPSHGRRRMAPGDPGAS